MIKKVGEFKLKDKDNRSVVSMEIAKLDLQGLLFIHIVKVRGSSKFQVVLEYKDLVKESDVPAQADSVKTE